jgi:hypothetical protein
VVKSGWFPPGNGVTALTLDRNSGFHMLWQLRCSKLLVVARIAFRRDFGVLATGMAQTASNVMTSSQRKKIMVDHSGIPTIGIGIVALQTIRRIFAGYMIRRFGLQVILPVTAYTFNTQCFKLID